MCTKNKAKEYYKNNRDVILSRSKEYYIILYYIMHKNNICRFADFGQVKKYCRFATLGKSKKYCRFADFGQVKKILSFC